MRKQRIGYLVFAVVTFSSATTAQVMPGGATNLPESVARLADRLADQASLAEVTAKQVENTPADRVVEVLRTAELNEAGTAWHARRSLGADTNDRVRVSESDKIEIAKTLTEQAKELNRTAQELRTTLARNESPVALERTIRELEASKSVMIALGSPSISAPDGLGTGSGDSRVNNQDVIADYVVGAGAATVDYPSVGMLIARIGFEDRIHCTATLISPRVVLTAAHCVTGQFRNKVSSVFFQHAGRVEVVQGEPRTPGYTGEPHRLHDIAVLQLARPVQNIRPASLSSSRLPAGAVGTIVGYGLSSPLDGSGQSIGTDASVPEGLKLAARVETKSCREIAGLTHSDGRICWEYKGLGRYAASTCHGDSGGPLFVEQSGRWVLAGVTSFGIKPLPQSISCAVGSHAIDSDVAPYFSWIKDQILELDGTAAPPMTRALEPVINGGDRYAAARRFEKLIQAFPTAAATLLSGQNGLLIATSNGSARNSPVRLVVTGPDGVVRCQEQTNPPVASCIVPDPQSGQWRIELSGAPGQEVQYTLVTY
jgi:hypothetical protein